MKKTAISTIFLLFVLFVRISPVFAFNIPSFPSCINPQGSTIANFSTGNHGIVGQGEKQGSDSVFKVSDTMVTQCFCPENSGDGIQTNWLKAAGLSSDDRQTLLNNGWTLVPNGADWGLDSGEYFAHNFSFVCGAKGGIGGGDLLGFASTGNTSLAQILAVVGVVTLLTGILLERTASSKKA